MSQGGGFNRNVLKDSREKWDNIPRSAGYVIQQFQTLGFLSRE